MVTINLLNPYFQFFQVDTMEQLEIVIKQVHDELQTVTITLAA